MTSSAEGITSMRVSLCAAVLLTIGASASAAPPEDTSPILVQGTRDRDKQISDFIKDLTPAPVHGQLSRFETSVCPAVTGLPEHQSALIAERMRRVARAADIPVGKTGCRPNTILIVTNDKAALLKQLELHRPDYFPENWSSWHVHDVER